MFRKVIKKLAGFAFGTPPSIASIGRNLYLVGAVLTLLACAGLFAEGIVVLMRGLFHSFTDACAPLEAHEGTKKLLHALELYFIAPLPFLIYWGACRLVSDVLPRKVAPNSETSARGPFAANISEESERNIEIVKRMMLTLIVGVYATDSLGKALTENGLTYQQAFSHGTIMLVLILLIWVLKPAHARKFKQV